MKTSRIDIVISSLPVIATLSLYFFVVYFRITYSHWPYENSIDTSELYGVFLYFETFVLVMFMLALFSPALALLNILIKKFYFKGSVKKFFIVFISLWVIWVVLLFTDPGNFYNWYFS